MRTSENKYAISKGFRPGSWRSKSSDKLASPSIDFSSRHRLWLLKEYHIFDAIFHTEYECFKPKRHPPWKRRTWRRNRFINKPEHYLNYFSEILKHKCTPDRGHYSVIRLHTPKTYQLIRGEFEKRNTSMLALF